MSEVEQAAEWNISELGLKIQDTLGSDVDRAWAAGFFDGEGHAAMVRGTNGYPSFRVAVSQATDYASLRRFARIMGVGRLYGPYRHKKDDWSPTMQFYAHNEEAMHVVAVMFPYLGKVKLTQALRAADQWRLTRRLKMQEAAELREERKRHIRQRTHCKYGHELTSENTYPASDDPTRLDCRTCRNASARRSYYRNKT